MQTSNLRRLQALLGHFIIEHCQNDDEREAVEGVLGQVEYEIVLAELEGLTHNNDETNYR